MKQQTVKITENGYSITGQKLYHRVCNKVVAELVIISTDNDPRILMTWVFTPERGWQKLDNDILMDQYNTPSDIIDKWHEFDRLFETILTLKL